MIFTSYAGVTYVTASYEEHCHCDRMKLRLPQRHFPILGCIVLVLLVVDVLLKSPENRLEIMCACYWASAAVAAGMLLGSCTSNEFRAKALVPVTEKRSELESRTGDGVKRVTPPTTMCDLPSLPTRLDGSPDRPSPLRLRSRRRSVHQNARRARSV